MIRRMIVILGAVLAGCTGGVEVSHDYDTTQDFSKLKVWNWAPAKTDSAADVPRVSSLSHERIRRAIERELIAKHCMRVGQGPPDFLVRYFAAIGPRFGERADGDWSMDDLRVYDEGTLIVDVITPEENRLVWRGAARTDLDFSMTPEEREKKANEVVHEIFKNFPPVKEAAAE